jgi:DNA-binding MarR family transcriptional regulator
VTEPRVDETSHAIDRPDERATFQVIATSHELRAALEESLGELGLTLAQWKVLVQLLVEPGRSSADIARSSVVSQQAISGLVARLEKEALLTRAPHPEHGRIQRLTTTARGRKLALDADESVRGLERELRAWLGEEDAEQLRELLLRVRGFLATRRAQADG